MRWDSRSTSQRPNARRSGSCSGCSSGVVAPAATVYLDGAKYGDTQTLKIINGERVSRVQYLNGSEATTRYGADHVGGAILITTR